MTVESSLATSVDEVSSTSDLCSPSTTSADKMSSVQSLHHDGIDSPITPMSNAFLGLTNQQLTPKLVKIGKVSSEKVFRAGDPTPKKSNRLHYSREQLLEISKLEISKEKHIALKNNPNAPLRDPNAKPPPLQLQRPTPSSSFQAPFLTRAPRDPKDKEIKLKKESQTAPPGLQKNQFSNNQSGFNGDRETNIVINSRVPAKDDKNPKTLPPREFPPRRVNRPSRDFDRNDDYGRDSRSFLRSRGEDLSNNFNRQNHYRNNNNGRYDSRKQEEEPEWYVNGPTSQHDVIELNGFESPEPSDREEKKATSQSMGKKSKKNSEQAVEKNSSTEPRLESTNTLFRQMHLNAGNEEEDNKAKEDFDLDEIFKLEWQRSLVESVDRSSQEDGDIGASKFAKWFNGPNNQMFEQQPQQNVVQHHHHHQFEQQFMHQQPIQSNLETSSDGLNKLFGWNQMMSKGGNDMNDQMIGEAAGSSLPKNENLLLDILKKARINVDSLTTTSGQNNQINSDNNDPSIKQKAKSAAELEANLLQGHHSALPPSSLHSMESIENEMPRMSSDSELLQRLLRQSNRVRNFQNSFDEPKEMISPLQQQNFFADGFTMHQMNEGQQHLQHQHHQQQQQHSQQAMMQPQQISLAKLFANANQNERSSEQPERNSGNKFNSNVNTFLPTSVIRKIASDKEKAEQLNKFNSGSQSSDVGFEQFNRQSINGGNINNMFNNGGGQRSPFEQQKWEHELLLQNNNNQQQQHSQNKSQSNSDYSNEFVGFTGNDSVAPGFGMKRGNGGGSGNNFFSVPNSKSVSPSNQEMAFIRELVQGNSSSRHHHPGPSDLHQSPIPPPHMVSMQYPPNMFASNPAPPMSSQQGPPPPPAAAMHHMQQQHFQQLQQQQRMQRLQQINNGGNGGIAHPMLHPGVFSTIDSKDSNQFMQMMHHQAPVNQFGDYERMATFNHSAHPQQQSMASAMAQRSSNNHTPVNLRKMFEDDLGSKGGLLFPQVPIQKAIYLDEIERQ